MLRKGANDPLCLQVGGRVFLWHAGAAKTALLVTVFFAFLNNVVLKPFPIITTVPLGAPGNPNVYAQPNPPSGYSG